MTVQLLPAKVEARPGEKLAFTLVNTGPGSVSFRLPYRLERDDHGEWVSCNVERAWTLALLGLRPGGRHEAEASVPDDAPPGRYRVSKEIQCGGPGHTELVMFEFAVIDP
jgi:hypothetical protein